MFNIILNNAAINFFKIFFGNYINPFQVFFVLQPFFQNIGKLHLRKRVLNSVIIFFEFI
ncbi:hypothetical protein D3C86_1370300 [compost metagenome]